MLRAKVEGYRRAVERELPIAEEAAAKSAAMRCAVVSGNPAAERAADLIVERLDRGAAVALLA